jgi:asparagine N-glycosylation enzyme membrane subunit Stt3
VKHSERITPVAAILSGVVSITCCLPFAFPAALGFAGLGVFLGSVRPWLTVASVTLLAVGLVQIYRKRACGKSITASLLLFGVAALIVLGLALFPQLVASLLADLQ